MRAILIAELIFCLCATDGHVYAWHKDTGSLMEVLEGHRGTVNMTAWHPTYSRVFASCGDDQTM